MTNRTSDSQVGGSHYKDMLIQPLEYIIANKLSFCEGNVVKYVSRWKNKNGIEDLRKARQYLDMLIEQEIEGDDVVGRQMDLLTDALCRGNS